MDIWSSWDTAISSTGPMGSNDTLEMIQGIWLGFRWSTWNNGHSTNITRPKQLKVSSCKRCCGNITIKAKAVRQQLDFSQALMVEPAVPGSTQMWLMFFRGQNHCFLHLRVRVIQVWRKQTFWIIRCLCSEATVYWFLTILKSIHRSWSLQKSNAWSMGTYITCSPVSCTPCSPKKQLTTYLPNTRAPVRKDSTPVYLLLSSQFVGSLADLRPVTEAQLMGSNFCWNMVSNKWMARYHCRPFLALKSWWQTKMQPDVVKNSMENV